MRGLIAGILVGCIVAWVEIAVIRNIGGIREIIPMQYLQLQPIVFGGLSGFGALAGDSVKSFFKRQLGIPAGKMWFPFDQIDYIIGGILCTLPLITLSVWHYTLLGIVWFFLHPLSTWIGYLLKLKEQPI